MSEATLIPADLMSMDPVILDKINSYEDFLSFYIQLDQAHSTYSWLKADLLLSMTKKLGDGSLKKFARDINQPASTVINYVRTAIAFPPYKRDPAASFSIHFQASFADSLNEKTKEFNTNYRYDWIDRAVDQQMSTRKLAESIQMEKAGEPLLKDQEQRQMIAECDRAIRDISNYLDNLYKEVRIKNDKEAYFAIVKIHQMINV